MVVGKEVRPVANMTVFLCCRDQGGIQGDLRKGGPLGGMTVGVEGVSGVDGTVGTRMALESSP